MLDFVHQDGILLSCERGDGEFVSLNKDKHVNLLQHVLFGFI